MQLNQSWRDALTGVTFSNGQGFEITADERVVPLRLDAAEDLVRGKRVVHVGCVDHVPLLSAKIDQDLWMHGRLTRAAATCVGVDVNAEGIAALQELGYDNVFVGDITHPDSFVEPSTRWDLLFLGEIVEHVDNPVDFLSSIRRAWEGRVDEVVLTVPNAFAWSSLRSVLRSVERINTDHRYWFTPFTAAKVAMQAGFEVSSITMCENFPPARGGLPHKRLKQWMLGRWLRRNPLMRSSILIVLAPDAPTDGNGTTT